MRILFYALAVVMLIAIYHFLTRLFAKGEIIDAYIINDKFGPSVLLLIDYATTIVSRGGISRIHSFKFKKINLQELSVQYDEKIIGFISDMLDGFVKILGMNEQFAFIVSYNYDFIVFEIVHGKIICNKKEIIKRNPNLAGFDPNSCVYNNSVKSVVIFDDKQNAYLLNTATFNAEHVNFDKNHVEQSEVLQALDNFPSVNIDKSYLVSDPISYFNDSGKYNIDFISDKGSKNFFLSIKDCGSDEKANLSDHTFLSPKMVKGNPDMPNFLIVHLQNLNPKILDIYISMIDEKGKECWKHNIVEVAIGVKFSEHSFLYFSEFKNRIYFIYSQKSSDRLSISAIDKYSGEILLNPKSMG